MSVPTYSADHGPVDVKAGIVTATSQGGVPAVTLTALQAPSDVKAGIVAAHTTTGETL